MEINDKYRGDMDYAIMRRAKHFYIRSGDREQNWRDEHRSGRKANRHKVLQIYRNVNLSVGPVLLGAVDQLRQGRPVDLKKLLA